MKAQDLSRLFGQNLLKNLSVIDIYVAEAFGIIIFCGGLRANASCFIGLGGSCARTDICESGPG